MAAKMFTDICQSKGTAQTLRLTEPWHHSGRTVNGDSAFASVQTAVELKKHGMFFKGMVKTAHSGFPKTYLETVEYPECGDWITLAVTVQGHCIFATGWGDMTRKNLVHTDGVSGEGTPHGKRRWRECDDAIGTEVVIRYTKRPKVVEDYFDCAKVIDIANHMRQGGLALEQAWKTQKWEHRLYSTLLGMIETDAYCAWRHFHPDGASDEHADFLLSSCLQIQLIMCELRHVGVLAWKTQFWMYMQMKHWLMILFCLLNTPSMPEVRRLPLELAKRPYLDAMYAGIWLRCTAYTTQHQGRGGFRGGGGVQGVRTPPFLYEE